MHLAGQRHIWNFVVSQLNGIITLEESIILHDGAGEMSSIKFITGQEKEEKTIVKTLAAKNGDKNYRRKKVL